MMRYLLVCSILSACTTGQTLGDMNVRGTRTGLFEDIGFVSCSTGVDLNTNLDTLSVWMQSRSDSRTSYSIQLPVPPDSALHPTFGNLTRNLDDGPAEFERLVPVYADLSLGDRIEGPTVQGDAVYVHRLVVPRNGDLGGQIDQAVLGCL